MTDSRTAANDSPRKTRVGVIGCGYVFDHYMTTWGRHEGLELAGVADRDMARAQKVGSAYGLKIYASNDELLADPTIEIVANFTSIESHYEVTKAALLAGKHVYSEKPLTPTFAEAQELAELAASRGLALSCAPSNALSATTQTMWRALRDGVIGDVRIVYAEFDDNPIYLMQPEGWRSRTGAPWPYLHEYEQGCTYEHVGYHLTWLCSMFGPVESVTAFSKQTIPDKTPEHLDPADTPDFSVACLNFRSGVTARVTCSIGAPYDHRMRIIGNQGMLSADTYRHYECPVYLERFSKLSLNARKAITVRQSSFLQWLFGARGKPLKLIRRPPPGSRAIASNRSLSPKAIINRLKQKELGLQDKSIGIAELADALRTGRSYFPAPDFTLHLTELTIAIQGAGVKNETYDLKTTFAPIAPQPETLAATVDYSAHIRPGLIEGLVDRLLDRMHKH